LGGVILIIVLTIAGGMIAYAGDRIGMKVGRKRLSIFGLRPKYTSMVITIITGVVIAGCTLLVLSLASENVRIALFEIRELQDSLAAANTDLDAKMAEVDVLSARVKEVADEYDALEAKFEAANQELERVSQERERALLELSRVESDLRDSEIKLKDTETRYQQAGADLAQASESWSSRISKRAILTFSEASDSTRRVHPAITTPVMIVMTIEVYLGLRPKMERRFRPTFMPMRSPA
jgi:uncharacterized protein (DUF3084 family)